MYCPSHETFRGIQYRSLEYAVPLKDLACVREMITGRSNGAEEAW
jgi:hypothetical protein